MAIPTDGSYGVEEGIISSYPVTCSGGTYEIVQGLEISDFSRGRIDKSTAELADDTLPAGTGPRTLPSSDRLTR